MYTGIYIYVATTRNIQLLQQQIYCEAYNYVCTFAFTLVVKNLTNVEGIIW